MRAERATLKLKFRNEWMNERNILGFKLCTEAKNFYRHPQWQCHSYPQKQLSQLKNQWFFYNDLFQSLIYKYSGIYISWNAQEYVAPIQHTNLQVDVKVDDLPFESLR